MISSRSSLLALILLAALAAAGLGRDHRAVGRYVGKRRPVTPAGHCAIPSPSDVDAQIIMRALDSLTRAYCSGDEKAFRERVSPHYELHRPSLIQAFRRAHKRFDTFTLGYRIANLRLFQTTEDICIHWEMTYRVKKTGVQVHEHGTTSVALDRNDKLRLLSQKGTLLFGSF